MRTFRQDQIDRDFDIIAGQLRAPSAPNEWQRRPAVSMWTLRAVAAMGIVIAAVLVWATYSVVPVAGFALALLSPALPLAMVIFTERHQGTGLI